MAQISQSTRLSRTRPPHSPVLTDPDFARPIDWSPWYLTEEEDIGQSPDQAESIDAFASSLAVHLRELGKREIYVGRDNFFGWVEGEPLVQVSPDVFALAPPPARPLPTSFQTWREGIAPPILALEIVSAEWRKDYDGNPPKYAGLGVHELVIFDPAASAGRTRHEDRVPLQVWRRSPDGNFVRLHYGDAPAYCESVDAWLVIVPVDGSARLRLARDEAGHDLVPTEAERAEAEAARADAAEAELALLRARLAALEGR